MQTISQPFSSPNPNSITSAAAPSVLAVAVRYLPVFFLVVWMCGCVAVLFSWGLRFRRLRFARQAGLLAKSGRELEALRRVEQSSGRSGNIDLIFSDSALEPGILRPVLLLPAGISGRLNNGQLESIITHELCHVRRHDNLASALHMLVEAVFWFHPLVWWIGARLVDERERACDEQVLKLGTDPQVYAESILKVCEFYVESPLFCAAGVTGSDLKRRIEAIMIHRSPRNLDLAMKLLLAAIAAGALLVPFGFGLVNAAQGAPESDSSQIATAPFYNAPPARVYEAVSINKSIPEAPPSAEFRPDGLTATGVTLQILIQQAYGVRDDQIAGAPAWMSTQRYDLEARVDESLADELGRGDVNRLSAEQQPMLLELLADRFKLSVHRETRGLPAYALVIARKGSKLHEATPGDTYPDGLKDSSGSGHGEIMRMLRGQIIGQGVTLDFLAEALSSGLGRTVLNRTGLTGEYDFTLQWSDGGMIPPKSGPSIFTAIRDRLGLELLESKEQTVPVEMLVIDHAEQLVDSGEIGTLRPAHGYAVLPTQNASTSSFPFQAVTIKANKTGKRGGGFTRDQFMATNATLHALIAMAYGAGGSEIFGGPDWVRSEHYDIEWKLGTAVLDELSKLGPDQRLLAQKRILQALLADRFRLALHRETREPPAYVLAIAKDGFKLQEAKPGDTYLDGFKDPQGRPLGAGALFQLGPCKLVGQGVHILGLAKTLSMNYLGGRTVVDQTGLWGVYDFTLDCHTAFTERGESVLTVLPEQLGLELKLLDNLVIDSAEKPSEN